MNRQSLLGLVTVLSGLASGQRQVAQPIPGVVAPYGLPNFTPCMENHILKESLQHI